MTTLSEILPAIWHRLIGRPRAATDAGSARVTRRLINELAERERKIDALERVGLGSHAAENLYNKPSKLQD